jgi:hypothetical protein
VELKTVIFPFSLGCETSAAVEEGGWGGVVSYFRIAKSSKIKSF